MSACCAFAAWLLKVEQWLTTRQPQNFGYFRSRWSCELLANTLA